MRWHFLHSHLTFDEPIFHPGHFPIQIQTGTQISRPCWKNLVYQNWISQISDQYLNFDMLFDFDDFLLFWGHMRSKIVSPYESRYITSYITFIDIFSLSRAVFEIFDLKNFKIWPWPLAFRGHLRSKIFPPFESPYMTFYITSIDTLSYGFRDIRLQSFQGLTLIFDLWRSPEVENIFTLQKPLHDFLSNLYWHFLSISYGLRDIRLQSFEGSTLTFNFWRSPEVQKNSPFERPYKTSYLTSIDTSL